MTLEQTGRIIEKIRIHRPSFLGHLDKAGITNFKIEWNKILEPYAYEDVDKKLDDYFQDSTNYGKYPDVYYLIRFLRTIEEKEQASNICVKCQICNEEVDFFEYDTHFNRCSGVNYLEKISMKYFGKHLDVKKVKEKSEKEFNEFYKNIIKQIYKQETDEKTKYNLKNVLLSLEGKEPKFDLERML